MGSQKPDDAQMTGQSGHFASPAAEPRASVTGRRARGMDEGVCEETALRKRVVDNEYGPLAQRRLSGRGRPPSYLGAWLLHLRRWATTPCIPFAVPWSSGGARNSEDTSSEKTFKKTVEQVNALCFGKGELKRPPKARITAYCAPA